MDSWLSEELASCAFKDKRLADRFRKTVETLSQGVGKSIPEVCDEWAMTKSTYRFLSNENVDESEILSGHFQQTARRIAAAEGSILILHDTSEFSYKRNNPEAIGFTRKGYFPSSIAPGLPREYSVCGILMHASLAVTPESLPLGLTSARYWTRDVFKNTTQMKRHINPTRIPIEKKESIRWLQNLEATNQLISCDPMKLIHVGDRENDIYEYFCMCVKLNTFF